MSNTNTNTPKVTDVEYRPTRKTVKTLKRGEKRTKTSSYYFRVKRGGVWVEVCNLVNGGKEDPLYPYCGTMSSDRAAAALPYLMRMFGIEVPNSVEDSAQIATKRLARKTVKNMEKRIAYIDAGVEAARTEAAEKAEARWEKMELLKGDYVDILKMARKRAGLDEAAE